MRIGILTHHWVYNFGANLQALSTCNYLSAMGHEAWILNYRPQAKEDAYRQWVSGEQAEVHESFCDTYLRQSLVCRSENELIEFCAATEFDAIWVGSDAMFRLSDPRSGHAARFPNPYFPNPYWLQWAKSGLHPAPLTGSLAASAMGANYFKLPASVRHGIADAICSMNHVSVRDRWTWFMLFAVSMGRCRPDLCPDPAFVLNDVFQVPDEYAREPAAERGKYILLSIKEWMLPDDWLGEFVRIAHHHGLQVVSLPFPEGEVAIPVDRVVPLPLSPIGWYAWIQNAAGFAGIRMHPVICSIINSVPFLSLDTYQSSRLRISSKTYDLCARADVRSRCLSHRQRRRLKPHEAFEKLQAGEEEQVGDYVSRAKRDFSQTIGKLSVRDI